MSKLNILLITSDQQHWNTLGQFNPEIQTPALDRSPPRHDLHARLLPQPHLHAPPAAA